MNDTLLSAEDVISKNMEITAKQGKHFSTKIWYIWIIQVPIQRWKNNFNENY